MHSPESEEYGFPRSFFPREWREHKVLLLTNNAQVTVDDRLSVHIVLFCSKCYSESVVRWRFSNEYTEYTWAAALSKMLVLHGFSKQCDGTQEKHQVP